MRRQLERTIGREGGIIPSINSPLKGYESLEHALESVSPRRPPDGPSEDR